MSNNLNLNQYAIDNNDKGSALQVLKRFQKKNKNFIRLVQTFNLEWRQPILDENITNSEIINKIKNIKTTIKN